MSSRNVDVSLTGIEASINRCDTLAELVDLVPAPFRPRMQDLVNQVYRAAVKSNHARSYLSTLERHAQDNTFPPEIQGRVHNPSLQISKEYNAAAACKSALAALDNVTRQHKTALLQSAIQLKTDEVNYLQSLFSEDKYLEDVKAIFRDVTFDLAKDAGLTLDAQGNVPIASMPGWMKEDCQILRANGNRFPSRAVAIAYATVQKETTKKFKSLSLKRKADDDVEMQDASSKTETVDALVTRKVEQLLKEYKNQKPGMTISLPAMQKTLDQTDTPRKRKGSQDQKSQTQPERATQAADSEGHQSRHGKRKRERREEDLRQVARLDRVLRGVVAGSASVASANLRGVSTCSVPLTTLRRTDRTLCTTDVGVQMLELHSELFCGTSSYGRLQFVSSHTPVQLFEPGHRFADGIFKGPGVVIPRNIEYKLALNSKFILHHPPNPLRVHQAWFDLERSVRLRWHFRHSDRVQSKFYVPKKSWMPPR
jgi:hypothetical protein